MDLRTGKRVKEIIQLKREEGSTATGRTVYTAHKLYTTTDKKKKKSPWPLNKVDKVVYTVVKAQQQAAQEYMKEHDNSKRERRDGWLFDLPANVFKATRSGANKLKAVSPNSILSED